MSSWKECKLGDFAEIKGGKRLPKGELLVTEKTPHPYIRITDFNGHKINLSAIQYVTEEVQKSISRYIVNKQDIIISNVGTIGLCAKIPDELDNANLTENCIKLVFDKNKIDTNFLYYHLISPDTQDLISGLDVGSTQPKLPIYNIEKIDISLPPLEEQKAIAEILSSLDDKIDLLHRQNQTLESLAQTLFRQWFIEEAKEEWEVGKLPDEFDFTMGLSPSGSTYNEEQNGMPMFQGNADFEFRFPSNRVYTTDPKRIAERFDTLISVRAPVGAQNMAKEKCCIGRGVASFRYKFDNSFYTYTYYKMHSLMEEIKQFNETGTVFGSIGKSDFEAIEIAKPPFEYVAKFQNEVKSIDDKIILNCEQIKSLENLRDTLLLKLLSGEIKIKD
ncbi:restriction endonuclease subunit S [Aliarcobacter butzleri]|uniref:restriction endonuclease subunit S n=1 Tax=Aliarcobacter butzleri TaxID=28197 RepID=UPI0021B3ABA2|nr:restriction endonuclease subunit S [Aliarcobacter butzleri]MCT7576291.1 restriction endonuclease subunit S [Aliarcobacter butzleri]